MATRPRLPVSARMWKQQRKMPGGILLPGNSLNEHVKAFLHDKNHVSVSVSTCPITVYITHSTISICALRKQTSSTYQTQTPPLVKPPPPPSGTDHCRLYLLHVATSQYKERALTSATLKPSADGVPPKQMTSY